MYFTVKACNDAHVALTTSQNSYSSNTYEICIGGSSNTYHYLRRSTQGTNEASCSASDLDCSNSEDFWISWASGTIALGTGTTAGSNTVCSFSDSSPYTVNYVSVSTGWGATGEWTIYGSQGSLYLIYTISLSNLTYIIVLYCV